MGSEATNARRAGLEPFSGVGVALVTLFDDDGDVDIAATAAHAQRIAASGISAVVVAGSTGEAAALEVTERTALLRAVRAVVDVPAIAGTGAPSSRQASHLTTIARDEGADAVLVLAPPFVDDVRPYYDAVAKAANGTPVLAYHWPLVSAPGIAIEQLCGLPVAGVKDSTGDLARLAATLEALDGAVYTGSQAVLDAAHRLGASGAILGIANAEPELAIRAWDGDVDAQRDLQRIASQIRSGLVGGLKSYMAKRFGTSPVTRLA